MQIQEILKQRPTNLEGTLRHGVLGGHADLLALLGNRHEAGELARLAAVDLDAVVQVLLLQIGEESMWNMRA